MSCPRTQVLPVWGSAPEWAPSGTRQVALRCKSWQLCLHRFSGNVSTCQHMRTCKYVIEGGTRACMKELWLPKSQTIRKSTMTVVQQGKEQ